VGQFRKALKSEKPVLTVEPSQDKIRMQHYAALTSHIFMKQAFHDEVYDTDTAILIARHEPQTGIEALKGQRVVDLYRTPSR